MNEAELIISDGIDAAQAVITTWGTDYQGKYNLADAVNELEGWARMAIDFLPDPINCTICGGLFDLDKEGGVEGDIGILPVAFCPTCKAGIFDFVEQYNEQRPES